MRRAGAPRTTGLAGKVLRFAVAAALLPASALARLKHQPTTAVTVEVAVAGAVAATPPLLVAALLPCLFLGGECVCVRVGQSSISA
jgi:hypothetical protein